VPARYRHALSPAPVDLRSNPMLCRVRPLPIPRTGCWSLGLRVFLRPLGSLFTSNHARIHSRSISNPQRDIRQPITPSWHATKPRSSPRRTPGHPHPSMTEVLASMYMLLDRLVPHLVNLVLRYPPRSTYLKPDSSGACFSIDRIVH